MMFRACTSHVPGNRNTQKPCQYWNVPGVPGVPGLCASVRVRANASRARASDYFPRVYTRNTRNTRNNLVTMRVSGVPCTRNIQHGTRNMEKAKPMRQAMPQVAAWIDELRTVFGAECINSAIKAGIDGQPTFYASEGGLEIGTRAPYSVDRAVNGGDMSLDRKNAAADQEMISRRHK